MDYLLVKLQNKKKVEETEEEEEAALGDGMDMFGGGDADGGGDY
jgi:hypothetical protein